MEYKKFGNKYIIRIDKGEEVVDTLKKFCVANKIRLGTITGLGATNKVTIGLFEVQSKKYFSKELIGNHEIAPLYGNITTMNGEVYLHLHVNLGNDGHKSFAGHLNSAFVSATVEVIIDSIEGEVERKFSDEIGLNLLKFT
ncbi:MAG: PPC domain-containing DNA-binding protein [Methanofastidiosum sp.]